MDSDLRPRLTELLRAIGRDPRPRFGADAGFAIEVAARIEQRLRAWALVYRSYLAKEFAAPDPSRLWYSLHDALPATTTVLATHGERDVGAVTVVMDSPLALPADALYGDRLAELRARGRRPCEYVSLATEGVSLRVGTEVLMQSFRLALHAAYLERATDVVITINPRHLAFYQRTLLFLDCGEERSYAKVGGAPALLLRLPLDSMPARFHAAYGDAPGGLWRFFFGAQEARTAVAYLRRARRPLPEDDVVEHFLMRRGLWPDPPEAAGWFLRTCCPGLASVLDAGDAP